MQYGDPWTPPQQALVEIVLKAWSENAVWPKFQFVADTMERAGPDDAAEVLRSFPIVGERGGRTYSDVVFDHRWPAPPEDSEVALSVGALARHPVGKPVADAFVAILGYAAERRRSAPLDPTKLVEVDVTADEAERDLPAWPPRIVALLGSVIQREWPLGVTSWTAGDDTHGWSMRVSRDANRYLGLTVDGYIELVKKDARPAPVQFASPLYLRPDAAVGDAGDRESPPSVSDQVTTVRPMNPARAIEQLKALRADADTDAVKSDGPAHDEWKAKVRVVLQRALGKDSTILQSFEDVSYTVGIWTGAPGEDARDRDYFASQVGSAAAYIDAAIYELELDADPEAVTAAPPAPETGVGQIFVVHGHDKELKETVARLIERTTGRDVVILHEQPDAGKTIIEKFEDHAEHAVFAVVLLTPDDEGRAVGRGELEPRARQNVILELGYFLGRLGRSRVVARHKQGIRLPSDLSGLLYKPVDEGGAWRYELLKELRAAQIDADMNKV